MDRLPKTKCVFPECSFQGIDNQAVFDHQEDCCHRKAPCGVCGQSVAMSSLDNHLEDVHDQKADSLDSEWDLSVDFPKQNWLKGPPNKPTSDVSFYFNKMCLNDKTMMFWVSYNGPKKDNRKYSFIISMKDEGGELVLLSYRYCVPCDISLDVAKQKFLGVVINKEFCSIPVSKVKIEVY